MMDARKLFRPMPGAIAKGLLAMNAMQNIPIAEAIQVTMKTLFHSEEQTSKLVCRVGFRAMMYPIVMKVVRPAISSVRTVEPFSLRLKSFSVCLFSPFILKISTGKGIAMSVYRS